MRCGSTGSIVPQDIQPSTSSYHTPDRCHCNSIKDLLKIYSDYIKTTTWSGNNRNIDDTRISSHTHTVTLTPPTHKPLVSFHSPVLRSPFPPIHLVCPTFLPPDSALSLSLHWHPYSYNPPRSRFIRYNKFIRLSSSPHSEHLESFVRLFSTIVFLTHSSCV